jgi:hypothetical protein
MIELAAITHNTDAVRHLMWVEWQDVDSIPSHTGRNEAARGLFFYPHFVPDGTVLLLIQ